jgi:hypothetical protein
MHIHVRASLAAPSTHIEFIGRIPRVVSSSRSMELLAKKDFPKGNPISSAHGEPAID